MERQQARILPAMAIPCLVESCKFLWKYGLTPFRTQTLAKKIIAELRANFEIDDFSLKLLSNTAPHANIGGSYLHHRGSLSRET